MDVSLCDTYRIDRCPKYFFFTNNAKIPREVMSKGGKDRLYSAHLINLFLSHVVMPISYYYHICIQFMEDIGYKVGTITFTFKYDKSKICNKV